MRDPTIELALFFGAIVTVVTGLPLRLAGLPICAPELLTADTPG